MIKQQQIEAVYTQIVEATMSLLRSDCGSMQRVLPETGELLLLAQKGFAAGSANGWHAFSQWRHNLRRSVPDQGTSHCARS